MKRILFFLLVVFMGCTNNPKFLTLELTPYKEYEFNYKFMGTRIVNDSVFISYNRQKGKTSIFIDTVSHQGYSKFTLPYNVYEIEPVSDSVFVVQSNCNYDGFGADTSVKLVDFEGKIIKYLDLSASPLWVKANKGKECYQLAYLSSMTHRGNNLFVSTDKCTGLYPLNSPKLLSQRIPIVFRYNLETDEYHQYDIFDYPDLDSTAEQFYSNYGHTGLSIDGADSNYLFISFDYSPKFYRLNTNTGDYSVFSAKLFFIDTLNPSLDIFFPRYKQVFYSNKYDLYLRYVQYTIQRGGLILLDRSFKVLGEVFLPENCILIGIKGDKIWCKKGNSIVVYRFRPKKVKELAPDAFMSAYFDVLNSSCAIGGIDVEKAKENMIPYLEKFFPNEKHLKIILVPITFSCGSCSLYVIGTIAYNRDFFERNNIKLLIYSSGNSYARNFISMAANPDSVDYILDTLWYPKYLPLLKDISYLEMEGDSITFFRNYPSKDIEKIFDDILENNK